MDCLAILIVATVSAQVAFGSPSYYHGPTAKPHVLHSGYLADTHEVAAVKSGHLAALAAQSHGQGYGGSHGYNHDGGYSGGDKHSSSHGDLRYHGPTATPHVLHDGHIADTHEVEAAKAEHFAAVAKAKVHTGYEQEYSGRYAEHSGAYHGYSHHDAPYHGPLAKPVVLKSGYLADTHEVEAAKAEHFAAIAKAKVHTGYEQEYSGRYAEHSGAYHGYSHHDAPYHGPLAKPVVLKSGYLADTHEVEAAKAEHFAAVAKAKFHTGYEQEYSGRYAEHSGAYHGYSLHVAPYHGPLAKPVVLKSGYLADTHEVEAAKAEHFAAVAKAKFHTGYEQEYSGRYAEHSGAYHGYSLHVAPYHGPLAKPVVLKSGYLADTHEVAAAKAEHFAAIAKAKVHTGYEQEYSGRYAEHSGAYHGYSHHDAPYHGPLAKPVVLKSGYLADTHEVEAAKAEHFAAVAKAKVHTGYGREYSGRYAEHSGAHHGYSHHVAPYHGPLAKPVVLKSGYLADTHEVEAAKQHHIHLLHSN